MQMIDNAKVEAGTRLSYDALAGPGSAQRLYASTLIKKISHWENLAEDFKARRLPAPKNAVEDLRRLRSEGLTVAEKLQALHVALGQAPAAGLPAIPTSSPVTAVAAAVAASKPTWNVRTLAAMLDGILGGGTAKSVLRRPIEPSGDEGSFRGAWSTHQTALRLSELRARIQRDERQANSPEAHAQELTLLQRALFRAGVDVPGVMACFHASDRDREVLESLRTTHPRSVTLAQSGAEEFVAVLQTSDSDAAQRMTGLPAQSARNYLASIA